MTPSDNDLEREMHNDMLSWLIGLREARKAYLKGENVSPVYYKDAVTEEFWISRLEFFETHGRPWRGENEDGPLMKVTHEPEEESD